jgi:4-phospho-D-threonate 3-dehydrogenase / 4-phospho-D-erythronate 3-dehydrogenase
MALSARPLVGVTLGDPAGIGPEIIVKALAAEAYGKPRPGSSAGSSDAVYELSRPVVIGDRGVLERAARAVDIETKINVVERLAEGRFEPGTIDLLDLSNVDLASLEWGRVQAQAGRAAFDYIRTAIELALRREIDAMATAPINKEALRLGQVPFLDHTAMLAKLTASPDVLTMFVVRKMVIFFMARHMSMRQACDEVTADNVCLTLLKARAAMASFGQPAARFGVAALNPHAGEHGMFGDEEIREIAPGVERARAAGVDAIGPVPADAVFHQCLQGRFDAVLSLHHDQGHIAAKTYDFERTISITTGMPFVRASVDHGTAFDIAGKGMASAVGMAESVRVAARYGALLAEHGRASPESQVPSPAQERG